MIWRVEEGIGEERALLYDGERAVAARMRWPGALEAGQVEDALLVSRTKGATRGRMRFAGGEEALIDRLPRGAGEGGSLRVGITRSAIAERGRSKLAHARPTDAAPRSPPTLAQALAAGGHAVETVRRFSGPDWDELWSQAWEAAVAFPGGTLLFAPTAAMTLIDIDGTLASRELALAAVAPLAEAIRRFDLGGSVGVDFPTLETRAERKRLDEALATALADWDHERTAINGFGFVQLVARLERPSLLHRLAMDRAGAAARRLLRQAEAIEDAGALLLTCHPAVEAALRPDWLEQLTRRAGREVRTATDPALALEGGFAQIVPR